MLGGTDISTTADADGRFQLRNLPAGAYCVWVLATGFEPAQHARVKVVSGQVTQLEGKLRPDPVPGNLLRNPAFQVQWVRPGEPDGWFADRSRRGRRASALVRVPVDRACHVRVAFRIGRSAPVSIRWRTDPSKAEGREIKLERRASDPSDILTAEIRPDSLAKAFEKGFLFLEVLIETDGPLTDLCRHVAVTLAD
jgi:hypothetical protein